MENAGVRPEEDPGLLLHQGHHILHRPLTKASGTMVVPVPMDVPIFRFIEHRKN